MRKVCLLGLPVLLVLSGMLLCRGAGFAKTNGLTPEQIYEIHKEHIESTYGPGTGFSIESYGESGTGYVNHETGEVTWYISDDER